MAFSHIASKTMAATAVFAAAGLLAPASAFADPQVLQFGQMAGMSSTGGAIDYTVSNLQNTRQAGMVKDGVGFKAFLSDKYDSRVGGTRTELRIHPDGGSAGTNGCMGIEGNAATLRQFQRDLAAEIARGGGHFTLHVG